MKKLIPILLIKILFIISLTAQNAKQLDIESIKKMCGCFEVNYAFSETFSPDDEYQFHPRYKSQELEWAFLLEENESKLAIQHLLIVKDFRQNESVIKHWRQDWTYENQEFYEYTGNNRWIHKSLSPKFVKGQWTQSVFNVDDAPRYEGSASWVHVDGKNYWECIANSPLPRREYMHRSDYNILRRNNRHEITLTGWVHDQNNDKILLDSISEILISQEKGYNIYTKVEDSKCRAAQSWWIDNQVKWAVARKTWDYIMANQKIIILLDKFENQSLYQKISDLPNKQAGRINDIIYEYIKKSID